MFFVFKDAINQPDREPTPYYKRKVSIKTPVLFATDNGLYLRKYIPLETDSTSLNPEDPRNFRYDFQRCDVENQHTSETIPADQNSARYVPKYEFTTSQNSLTSNVTGSNVLLVPSKEELENSRKLKYQQIKMDTLKDYFPRM